MGDSIAEGDAFLINHPYQGGSPHAPDMCVLSSGVRRGRAVGFCGRIAHKSDIGGPVPDSCSGQARETFNEGLHLPAVRYQRSLRRSATSSASSPPTAARRSSCWAISAGSSAPTGWASAGWDQSRKIRQGETPRLLGAPVRVLREQLRETFAEWKDGRFEAERFVDDDGIDLKKPVRIHVVVEKSGDRLHFDFSGSADQTKGPANVRRRWCRPPAPIA